MTMAQHLAQRKWHLFVALVRTLVGCCAVAISAHAALPAPQMLDSARPSFEIHNDLQTLLEAGPSAGIAAIAAGTRGPFAAQAANTIFPLTENHTLWIRLRLASSDASPPDWSLCIPLPYLDHAVLYQADGHGSWTTQLAGDINPVSQWTRPGLYPEFRLSWPKGGVSEVYLQIRNFKPLGIPLRLASVSARETQRELEYTAIGVVLGALLMLMGVCTIQYLVTEDAADGWYTVYIVLMMVVISSATGVSGQWLWPHSPVWSNYSFMALPLLGVGATVLFARHMCALEVGFPRFARCMHGLGWISLPLALLSIFIDRASANNIQAAYLALAPVLTVAGTVATWRRGNPVGKWLFMAYLPQGLAVIFLTAQMFNLVPTFWEVRYAMVLALVISIPLVLHALHLRTRMRHEAEERASSLSRQDALTGLLVKPLFMEHVQETLERALHDKVSSAVVLVEVMNHAHLREAYGEAVAEQCLLRAVVKLHRVLRDVDPAGRVDTSRFGLILDGVSSRQALSERMVSLIASGLVPLPGLKPEVTLQFHIACVLLNETIPDPRTILDQLADVLDHISPRSRRPIRFLEPLNTVPAPLQVDSGFTADDTGSFMAPGAST